MTWGIFLKSDWKMHAQLDGMRDYSAHNSEIKQELTINILEHYHDLLASLTVDGHPQHHNLEQKTWQTDKVWASCDDQLNLNIFLIIAKHFIQSIQHFKETSTFLWMSTFWGNLNIFSIAQYFAKKYPTFQVNLNILSELQQFCEAQHFSPTFLTQTQHFRNINIILFIILPQRSNIFSETQHFHWTSTF